jgi:hypothetical protein
MAFETVIKRARYTVTEVPAVAMKAIATEVMGSVKVRILRGQTVTDANAMPLSMKYRERWNKKGQLAWMGADRGYRAQKAKLHPPAIRNWQFTGFVMSQMHVLEASNGQAKIGFSEALHPGPYGPNLPRAAKKQMLVSQIVAINQSREREFGVSPTDANVYSSALRASGVLNHIVVAKQV